MSVKDLPAFIDYIINYTGHKKLNYIGHSQGTTMFFVLMSELPEYNEKIIVMNALAPIMSVKFAKSFYFDFSKISNFLKYITSKIGYDHLPIENIINPKFVEACINSPICYVILRISLGGNLKKVIDTKQKITKNLNFKIFSRNK